MSIHRKFLAVFMICMSSAPVMASGPGSTNDFGGRRVLIIGIDGVRPDALQAANTPNIDSLLSNGIVTYNAIAGGHLGTPTQQATSSGPGWASILNGVWTDKHGVTDNSFSGEDFQNYPHFFRRIREAHANAYLSSIIHWSPIDTQIVEKSKTGDTEFLNFRQDVSSDALVASTTVTHLGNADPDAVFLHFDQVDGAGHGSGYSATNPTYLAAIENVDTHIGSILTAMQNRPQFAQEDWLVIVTTDHGGIGTGHGGQSADERTIFLITSGGNTPNGATSTATPGFVAVPPTAMRHLGIAVNPSWGWEEGSFGLPAPTFDAEKAGDYAILSWTIPSGGINGLTGFGIYRDGALLSTVSSTTRSFTNNPPIPGSGETTYNYEIRFNGTSETAIQKPLTFSGDPDITSNLEMHLAFDNNTTDSSGNGHNATAVGGAQYVTGVNGQAAVCDSGRYFTVPQTGGLLFGASTDFSVGFWVKTTGQWSSDPSFISNKDWDSGANQGWIIAGESNGPDWQWNLKGADASRSDFDNGGVVQDSQWHHILVSHDRDGSASFYQDGALIGSVSINGDGNTDTALPIAIGNDGTLTYTGFNPAIHIDDVKIWTRALGGNDAAELAGDDTVYRSWQEEHFTPAQLADPLVSGPNADPDSDGMENIEEFGLNGDPLTADLPATLTVVAEGNNYLISWPQRNGGQGDIGTTYAVSGVSYIIEYSTDLTNWDSGAAHITTHSAPNYLAPGWHMAKARLVTPPASNGIPAFFRIRFVK